MKAGNLSSVADLAKAVALVARGPVEQESLGGWAPTASSLNVR